MHSDTYVYCLIPELLGQRLLRAFIILFFNLFLIVGKLLYDVVVISAVHLSLSSAQPWLKGISLRFRK